MRRVGLLRKLIKTTLEGSGSVEKFVSDIMETSHKLTGIGFAVSDEWLGTLMLAGLPEHYAPMVMAIDSSGTKITADFVKTKLLQDVKFIPEDEASVALIVKGNKKQGQKKPPKCNNCKREDHFYRNCLEKKKPDQAKNSAAVLAYALSSTTNFQKSDAWYVDSGATSHMTNDAQVVQNFQKCGGQVLVANNEVINVTGSGNVNIIPRNSDVPSVDVTNVLLIPQLSSNLLSVHQIVEHGHSVKFTKASCEIRNSSNELLARGVHEDGMFRLDHEGKSGQALTTQMLPMDVWHKRFGHLNLQSLKKLRTGLVTGLMFKNEASSECISCAMGKQHRLPFSHSDSKTTDALQLIHTDLCGPMETDSLGGNKYFLTLIDDFSKKIFVYFLKRKSEVCSTFKSFKNMVENQTGKTIKMVRSDNGGEYNNLALKKVCDDAGIIHQFTIAHTPEQNGVAERFNRTLVEKVRCMLYEAKLPKSFWGEAVLTAVYVTNRSPCSSVENTPEERWSSKKPDVSHLRVFGSKVTVHIPKTNRKKLDAKAVEGIFVGYSINKKGYRIYDVKSKNVVDRRDVTFYEGQYMSTDVKEDEVVTKTVSLNFFEVVQEHRQETVIVPTVPAKVDPLLVNPHDQSLVTSDEENPNSQSLITEDETSFVNEFPIAPPLQSNRLPCQNHEQEPRRSSRERHVPDKYQNCVYDRRYGYVTPNIPQANIAIELKERNNDVFPFRSQTAASPSHLNLTNGFPKVTPKLIRSERGRFPTGKLPSDLNEPGELLPKSLHVQTQIVGRTGFVADQKHGPFFALPSQIERLHSKHGIEPRCSGVGRVLKGKFSNSADKVFVSGNSFTQTDPETPAEALCRPEANEWKLAMEKEYQALLHNQTWTLCDLPPGRKAIKSKWVFKTKKDVTGAIHQYKARLVIKGYSQRKGVDYDLTYSPVVRHSSLRYLFALAVEFDLIVEQMDAVTAFLQGDLKEEVYMEQPSYYVNQEEPAKVCRLNKALYGLKQSSRVWNEALDAKLREFGLHRSKYDPCIYHNTEHSKILFVAVYVDDLLIFSNDTSRIASVKRCLNTHFKMKDLGQVSHCLGIRITRSKDVIKLDQQTYVKEMLERFGMSNAKPASTPVNASEKISKQDEPTSEEEREKMRKIPYQEAVGSLMYLAQCTRPDIVFAVNLLSRFNNNPGLRHWNAVKHIFRYLIGTSDYGLTYQKAKPSDIVGFTDADWASNLDDRKSTSGYVFIANGAAISWNSKKQSIVALSSCEAEYVALSSAIQDAIWWHGFKQQLVNDPTPLTINVDNQSAIALAINGGYHQRTKHIDIRHHFIQDELKKGSLKVLYVPTADQVADVLTKGLNKIKHQRFNQDLGLRRSDANLMSIQ